MDIEITAFGIFLLINVSIYWTLLPELDTKLEMGVESIILDKFVSKDNFTVIENIHLYPRGKRTMLSNNTLCPKSPPGLRGKLNFHNDSVSLTWRQIEDQNPAVKGGRYAPENCEARFRVAIIIPYRDREEHLKILLDHLHPVLQRQQLDYTIFTVSFAGNGIFNKAKLMNAGFVEVDKNGEYDCYIFHDVDMLVENDRCLYWCSDEPREIAYHIDKFDYTPLEYEYECGPPDGPKMLKLFGGAVLFSRELFLEVNGYSNLYWGWGGEDDDMYARLWKKGHDIVNPYGKNCSFTMIKHDRDSKNAMNHGKTALLSQAISRMAEDGLNTLRYRRIALDRRPLYTNITLDVGEHSERLKNFMESDFKHPCDPVKLPWQRDSKLNAHFP